MKSFWQLSLVAVCMFAEPAFAQKLVDPNARCSRVSRGRGKAPCRANQANGMPPQGRRRKVLPRDRTAAINRCLEDGPDPTTAAARRSRQQGGPLATLTRPSLESLFGLNREADGDFGRAVENLEQMVAKQAAILAPWSTYGNQFNPAVTGIACGQVISDFFMVAAYHPAVAVPTRQPGFTPISLRSAALQDRPMSPRGLGKPALRML